MSHPGERRAVARRRRADLGAVAAFQDITSLYEVDRLKSEFVSIVSHELRRR